MDDGALEALVAELECDHPLHVRGCSFEAGQGEGDGPLHHGLAPLGWEVAHHLLLRGERAGSGGPAPPQPSSARSRLPLPS